MISRDDIRRCYDTIRPYIRRTPVIRVDLAELGEAATALPVAALKLEQLQCAGSFKARGAFTNLLLREVPPAGVVAASGGNHGVAVAYAARRRGIPAKIFVPTVSAPAKIGRIRELGADLVVTGERYADALGGGGLIAGTASWFAGTARVVGVEPDGAPTLSYARAEGRPADAPAGSVAADALAPRRVGELVFPITESYVDDVVLVDDESILAAQRALWQAFRIAAEPAASVGIAALLAGAYKPAPGEHVTVVISGANMSPSQLG